MKIEFGCGETPKEGFKTCDIRNVSGVDFVCLLGILIYM